MRIRREVGWNGEGVRVVSPYIHFYQSTLLLSLTIVVVTRLNGLSILHGQISWLPASGYPKHPAREALTRRTRRKTLRELWRRSGMGRCVYLRQPGPLASRSFHCGGRLETKVFRVPRVVQVGRPKTQLWICTCPTIFITRREGMVGTPSYHLCHPLPSLNMILTGKRERWVCTPSFLLFCYFFLFHLHITAFPRF